MKGQVMVKEADDSAELKPIAFFVALTKVI